MVDNYHTQNGSYIIMEEVVRNHLCSNCYACFWSCGSGMIILKSTQRFTWFAGQGKKLLLQLLLVFYLDLLLIFIFTGGTEMLFRFSGRLSIWGTYISHFLCGIKATSNAVNLTDCLDGLASGVTFFVALAYAWFASMTSHYQTYSVLRCWWPGAVLVF